MMRSDYIKTFLGLIIVVSFLWTIFMIKISNSVNFDADHLDSEYAMGNKHSLTTMIILDTVKNARVCQGDTLSVCYKIVNTGSDSLFLYRINPDCTCSDYSISSRAVSSGDTISLLLQVATDNKFDNNIIHVVLESNTKERMYMIRLPFFVESSQTGYSDSLMTKRKFKFNNCGVGEKKVIESYVVNNYSKDIMIELMTSCSCIDVYPRNLIIKSKGRCNYSMTILPSWKGVFSEYVIMRVVDSGEMFKVEVQGKIN